MVVAVLRNEMQESVKLVILANENPDDHSLWVKACEKAGATYRVVNLCADQWLEEVQKEKFDYLLTKPPGLIAKFKLIYDERVRVLERELGYKLYPSAEEIFIYENKRVLASWLEANKIPHPKTFVFYNREEALQFLQQTKFPLVGKASIGASGSGVHVFKSEEEVIKYTEAVFSGKGAKRRVGPNLKKGNLLGRSLHYVFHPGDIIKKLRIYKGVFNDRQTDFVIFQEFIPHTFEWRVVRIGDSFFAHKKAVMHGMASGSLLKVYDNPPLAIFDFVRGITERHRFYSQAIDIFEHDGNYLVNEMQCLFGQSDSYQMKVDGVIGRYLYVNDKWVFEPGDFNTNACYDLRLQWVIKQLNESTLR